MDNFRQAGGYIAELFRWSEKTSLLSEKDREKIFSRHFLDALIFSGKIPNKPAAIMDLGSGNGIPAVPLAIFRKELKIFCFESRIKKAAFLFNIKNKLSLDNLFIINDRIENKEKGYIDYFDIITARAFSNIDEIIRLTKKFAKKNAIFIVFNTITKQEPRKDINIVDKYVYKLPDGKWRELLSFKLL